MTMTIAAGSALTLLCLMSQLATADLPILPVVTLESLTAKPADYSGREIVVAGIVLFGEGAIMYLPIATPSGQAESMWVEMPMCVPKPNPRLEFEYLRLGEQEGGAIAVLSGRFETSGRLGFGHLNQSRFKLEITEVLSVGPISPRVRNLRKKTPLAKN
jgi:hypothetical protein